MNKVISFQKMQASGNDFVVVDNRKKIVKDVKKFTRKICELHKGVGADGVLLLENSRKGDFKMRIVNSDGSEAEACGNGFRCITRYAKDVLKYPNRFQFDSIAGLIQAQVKGQEISVRLPTPKDLVLRSELNVAGNRLHYSFINTGVPHVVVFVEGLGKIDVETLGRGIRNHSKFKPKGTNVNFVEVKKNNEIHVRTYERGVEQETQACGTGSTASAILSVLMGYAKAPVTVKTKSGERLKINFNKKGKTVSNVTLSGKAYFVFEGKVKLVS